LLGFFASFVLSTDVVQQIMRWDMAVLQESPWYQEILQQGERKGREEERVSITLKFLTRRVGNLSPEIAAQVQALSLDKLEVLGEALLDFSELDDLVNWLSAQP
jgi:predicted transposase YdaD